MQGMGGTPAPSCLLTCPAHGCAIGRRDMRLPWCRGTPKWRRHEQAILPAGAAGDAGHALAARASAHCWQCRMATRPPVAIGG